jgi:hypothetical protein
LSSLQTGSKKCGGLEMNSVKIHILQVCLDQCCTIEPGA